MPEAKLRFANTGNENAKKAQSKQTKHSEIKKK